MTRTSSPAPQAETLPAWMLLGTIFVTGNVVMMLEVVGTRVVGPFFGVGLYVWSALITVTLLSLAGGYWLGGKFADARRSATPLYLIILGSAGLTFLIPFLRNPFLTLASTLGFQLGTLVGSALLFGPALFLLGMVTPYATKLYTDRFEKLGSRVGFLYFISTLGSFLGTVTMGFYLIPTFRLSTILAGLGGALLLLPLAYFLLVRRRRWTAFAALVVLGAAVLVLHPREPEAGTETGGIKLLYKSTSFYGELKVLETYSDRILLIDGVSQSGEKTHSGWPYPPYIQDLSVLLRRYAPQTRRVLIVGLGGGNLIHELLARHMQVDVVEIDRQVVTASEKFFGVDPQQVRITLEDGRRYVRATSERYDAIVMNAFIGESSPAHLLSREFFQETKRILNPGGIMLVNFVGCVSGPDRGGAAAVYATLRTSYGWCESYYRESQETFGNVLYAAGDTPFGPAPAGEADWPGVASTRVEVPGWRTAAVCTDEYNPIDFLNRGVYRRWRQLILDTLGPAILLN